MLELKEILGFSDPKFLDLTKAQEVELGVRLRVLRDDAAFRYHMHLLAEQFIENHKNLNPYRPGSPKSEGDNGYFWGVLEGLSLALDNPAAIIDKATALAEQDQEHKETR